MIQETLFSIMKLYGINPVVRDEGTLFYCLDPLKSNFVQAARVAHRHPFVDGNKRAAYLIIVSDWLNVLEDI